MTKKRVKQMSYWQQRIQQLRIPAFRYYTLSCFVATLGTGLVYIAMAWQIVSLGGNTLSIMIMMLGYWIPNMLLGPVLGVLVDRHSRRTCIIIANVGRAIFLVLFAVLVKFHQSIILIDLLALTQGIFWALLFPAMIAFIREIIQPEELLYANTTIDMAFEIGNLLGYGLAGFIIAIITISGAYLFNAATFLLATVFLFLVKPQYAVANKKRYLKDFWLDFRLGLRYIKRQRLLKLIYTVQLLIVAQFMTAPTLLAPFVKQVLHARVGVFGHIELSCSLGILVGGIILPKLADKISLLKAATLVSIVLAISYIIFSFNRDIHLAELLYFLMGIGFAVWPLLITQAQHITAISYQGRTQATFNSLSGFVVCVTYLLVAIIGHWLSISWLYVLEAMLAIAATGLLVLFQGLRANPRI